MKIIQTFLKTALPALLLLAATTCVFGAERVLVVGDSITGHSMNLAYGFTHEVRKALEEAGSDMEFVPLGGSGQTIFSWRGIIANSYENRQRLDIPDIYVKDEFDKGADVLIVHLGMNDALRPSIKADSEGYAKWRDEYRALVSDLRKRVPGVSRIILTPPTLLTENPFAWKNEFMDMLGKIVEEVAKEENCEFYDLREDFKHGFLNARFQNPQFRITLDFVHPNEYGHQLMSWSFLKALGLTEIADAYAQKRVAPELKADDYAGAAFFVMDFPLLPGSPIDPNAKPQTFVLIVGVLNNLTFDQIKVKDAGGLDLVESDIGVRDEPFVNLLFMNNGWKLPCDVVLQVGENERTVRINAPYFVATGVPLEPFARPEDFPKDKATTAIDKAALEGINPLKLQEEKTDGKPAFLWSQYYPTQDKTGADNPNAVDLADLPPANEFDVGYVVRYVTSPKAQKCVLKLNSEGFSTTAIETIYLNGQKIYDDILSPRHLKSKDEVEVELKEGLNVMTARVGHTSWQWGTSFDFQGEGLKY